MAYSRLALQTQYLDVQKPNFPGIWGDFGGTLRRSSGASFRRDGFTAPIPSQPCWPPLVEVALAISCRHLPSLARRAPIPSQPCWPVLVNACTKWRELLLPRVFRDNFRMTNSFTTPFDPHKREVSPLQLQPGSRVLHIRFALMPICAPPNLEFVFVGRREAGSAASAISPRSVFGCYGIKAVESGFSPVAVSTGYAGRRPGARSLAGWRGPLRVSPVRPPCRNDRLRRRLRQGWRAGPGRVRR